LRISDCVRALGCLEINLSRARKPVKIKQVLNSVNTKHIRRLLRNLHHRKGRGRKPYNPLSILKAQLLKHLLRIPSDRRLALRLRHDRRAAKTCGFKKHTPSHGLFTHFRKRLGEETYHRVFNHLLGSLLEARAVKGEVIAVDSTHVDAYSQRAPDNLTGKSDPEARVGARAACGVMMSSEDVWLIVFFRGFLNRLAHAKRPALAR